MTNHEYYWTELMLFMIYFIILFHMEIDKQ